MARTLHEIIAHIRMVVANQQVSTTLIQTEDLEVLCDAADQAAPAVAVPGWQLVPKEPTFEMIKEMWSANEADNRVLMERTWIAALAAAPSPASGEATRRAPDFDLHTDTENDKLRAALAAASLAGWEEAREACAKECHRVWKEATNIRTDSALSSYRQNALSYGCVESAAAIRALKPEGQPWATNRAAESRQDG